MNCLRRESRLLRASWLRTQRHQSTTVDKQEVKNFERLANSWWRADGEFRELHLMNKLRVPFVRDGLLSEAGAGSADWKLDAQKPKPLEGFRVLDVGCGGGILSEPLARLGANVVGIDPGGVNVDVARAHAERSPGLAERLSYEKTTIEVFSKENAGGFDGVVCSETIEHVDKPDLLLQNVGEVLKVGGSLFLTTPSRTLLSLFGGVLVWEYVLRRLPIGTHDWNKFLLPNEVETILVNYGFSIRQSVGMCYNPLTEKWSWTPNPDIHFGIHAVKDKT